MLMNLESRFAGLRPDMEGEGWGLIGEEWKLVSALADYHVFNYL